MIPFMKSYRCYPISVTGKPRDKIIMPISATSLSTKNVEYPMLFQLQNQSKRKVSYCGDLEFSAEEGTVFLPSWIMLNMKLLDGDVVIIRNVSLKKATSVKLRPHETAFVELSNPKAVLEKVLRGFSCLAKAEKPAAMAEKVEEDDGLEKDESSFEAFTGKSYRLSD